MFADIRGPAKTQLLAPTSGRLPGVRRLPPKMRPPQPTAEHVLSAVVQASGISLDTLLGRRSRHEIVRVRAITAVILRSEAGLTAKEAGSPLRRSRQSVHNLIAKAARRRSRGSRPRHAGPSSPLPRPTVGAEQPRLPCSLRTILL